MQSALINTSQSFVPEAILILIDFTLQSEEFEASDLNDLNIEMTTLGKQTKPSSDDFGD